MLVKDLIEDLKRFPGTLEVGFRWDRPCRDGWQEMCMAVKGVDVRAVTSVDVLCECTVANLPKLAVCATNKVVIL